MKKRKSLMAALGLFLAFLFFIFNPVISHAVGTVSIVYEEFIILGSTQRIILTLTWTADAAAATVPDTVINATTYGVKSWYLYSAETNPGATAPTDNYDIVINDADGLDIAGGLLANRDATTTEIVNIGTSTHGFPLVRGNLTFVLSNNAVNSATGTLILFFVAN